MDRESIYLSDMEKILVEPVVYYYDLKGKDVRTFFCNYLGKLFGIDQEEVNKVSELICLLHNASLVIDDIQDNSSLRRNMPCAHIKYGVPLTLNAGYLVFFRLIMDIGKREDIPYEIKQQINENMYLGHIGQGMDIYYTANKIIPSMEDYNKMMFYKTGLLFTTMLDLVMGKTPNHLLKKRYPSLLLALTKFSQFYQIRDDYINLTDPEYWSTRGFCQDFDEKKISYLIVYCNNHTLPNFAQINKLLDRINTDEQKKDILQLMDNNNLFHYIYNILEGLKHEILEVLEIPDLFNKLPYSRFDMTKVDTFLHNRKKGHFNIC